jgi:hypothetical protein
LRTFCQSVFVTLFFDAPVSYAQVLMRASSAGQMPFGSAYG